MSDPGAPPPFPFSRETTIRIDRDGVFWHDGVRVVHDGLARAFARWIDVDLETGRYVLRNDVNWVYVTVDDAPLVVRGAAAADGGIELTLSDGTTERLDPATLRVDGDDVPYCDVRGGKLPARFTGGAAYALLERLRIDGERLVLPTAGGDVEVARVSRGEGARRRGASAPGEGPSGGTPEGSATPGGPGPGRG